MAKVASENGTPTPIMPAANASTIAQTQPTAATSAAPVKEKPAKELAERATVPSIEYAAAPAPSPTLQTPVAAAPIQPTQVAPAPHYSISGVNTEDDGRGGDDGGGYDD